MFLSKFPSLQNIIRSFVYGCCHHEFYSRREQEEEITERDRRDVGKAKIARGREREREREKWSRFPTESESSPLPPRKIRVGPWIWFLSSLRLLHPHRPLLQPTASGERERVSSEVRGGRGTRPVASKDELVGLTPGPPPLLRLCLSLSSLLHRCHH